MIDFGYISGKQHVALPFTGHESIQFSLRRNPDLIHRPARLYKGRTFLTAQQVEDVIAYLVTLK